MKKVVEIIKTLSLVLITCISAPAHAQNNGFSLGVSENGDVDGPNVTLGNQQTCSFPVGHPNLKALSVLVLVPNGNTLNIQYSAGSPTWKGTGYVKPVAPAIKENFKGDLLPESRYKNAAAYAMSQYPNKFYDVKYLGKYRGQSLAIIYIYPYKYNPTTQVTTIYKELELSVTYNGVTQPIPINLIGEYDPNGVGPTIKPAIAATPNFDKVIEMEMAVPSANSTTIAGCEFVIITHNDLIAAANRLKDYKISRGIETQVKAFSGTITEAMVKNYILSCKTMQPVPQYILFLGDVNLIPPSSSFENILTDMPYFDVDGEFNFIPNYSTGRMPIGTLAEANSWIDKIIKYEKTAQDHSFFKGVSLISFFEPGEDNGGSENRRYIHTSEELYGFFSSKSNMNVNRLYYSDQNNIQEYTYNDNYLLDGEAPGIDIPDDIKLPGSFSWNSDAPEIKNAFYDSKFLLIHRGHGSETTWGSSNYTQFSSSDVSSLSNSNYPVVWSINCSTGKFNYEAGDCISEKLVKKSNGGAVGIIAATDATNSKFNDYLARGLTEAIWPGFKDFLDGNTMSPEYRYLRMGDIIKSGLLYTLGAEGTGGTSSSEAQSQILTYTWLGDPTMEILPYLPCVPLRTFNNLSFVTTVPLLYDGAEKIVVSGTTIINSGANADFRASQSIRFTTGFKVNPGGLFHAVLEPCYVAPVQPDGVIRQNVTMKNEGQEFQTENQLSVSTIIEVYPNPTNGFITIRALGQPQNRMVEIYNQLGSLVYKGKLEEDASNIDLLPFGKGLYIVSIREESQMRQFKVVVY